MIHGRLKFLKHIFFFILLLYASLHNFLLTKQWQLKLYMYVCFCIIFFNESRVPNMAQSSWKKGLNWSWLIVYHLLRYRNFVMLLLIMRLSYVKIQKHHLKQQEKVGLLFQKNGFKQERSYSSHELQECKSCSL